MNSGGTLAPGTRLPSSRTLAADLGVSRTSVEVAFVQLKAQQAELDAKNGELTKLLADKQNIDEELKQLRAAVAAARKAAEAQPDRHNYNEAETRDRYIDLLLREAGWALDRPEDLGSEKADATRGCRGRGRGYSGEQR